MPAITKTVVDASQPAGSEYIVWDSAIRGFGLRVAPSGTKSYIFKYRVGGGRRGAIRKPTIGRHGSLTPDQARKVAKAWAAEVAQGRDPGGQRAASREGATVSELLDRFIKEHSEVHNAASSVAKNRRLIDTKIKPVLGKKRVADVTHDDINSLKLRYRTTPIEANRCLALLSTAFKFAGLWSLRTAPNPVRGIQKFEERPRDVVLTADELGRFGRTLTELEAEGENPSAIAALRLAALTGWRIGEVLNLQWSALDFADMTARITGKTGPRLAPVSGPVAAILAELPRDGDYVLPGKAANRHMDYAVARRVWIDACERAKISGARIHDLRHGAATIGAKLGAGAHTLRDLLGHRTLAMSNRYVTRLVDPVRDISERVATAVSDVMQRPTAATAARATAAIPSHGQQHG